MVSEINLVYKEYAIDYYNIGGEKVVKRKRRFFFLEEIEAKYPKIYNKYLRTKISTWIHYKFWGYKAFILMINSN